MTQTHPAAPRAAAPGQQGTSPAAPHPSAPRTVDPRTVDPRTVDLAEVLSAWAPRDDHLQTLRTEYLAYLADGGTAHRDASPQHLTASTFVFSPDLRQVLLCYHRKGQFWVQLGGHVEPGDVSVAAAAAREMREESGLTGLRLASPADLTRAARDEPQAEHLNVVQSTRDDDVRPGPALDDPVPVDLDRHGLGDGFGRCAVHWDVGFVALAPTDSVIVVSDESDDVAWWPVDALPAEVPGQLDGRLARVLAELSPEL